MTRLRLSVKQRTFLAAFAESGIRLAACKAAGVSIRATYNWQNDQDEKKREMYLQAFESAREEAINRLEQEARRRAVDGVEEPVFYQGQEVGRIRKYSDQLLALMLRAADPTRYAIPNKHEHSGTGGALVKIDVAAVRAQMLNDEKYVEYLSNQACSGDADTRLDGPPGEPGALEAGEASGTD